MKKTTTYACNFKDNGFVVTKFVDEEFETSYNVLNGEAQVYCDCLGFSHRSSCRHLTITSRFIKEDKVGKGYLFDFDKETFTKLVGAEEGDQE